MTQHSLIKTDPTKGVRINAADIAQPFRDDIQRRVKELQVKGEDAPLLVGLLANDDPAAGQYAEWTGKACRNDGLRYELRRVDRMDVERALQEANEDPRVHGILVYYPIFGQEETFSGASQDDYLRDSVSYKCDVEGLCHLYRSNLYRNVRYLEPGVKCLVPCTALSVVKILEACGCFDLNKPIKQQLQGKTVTIINRSEIVGRPLAAMLANDGAKVYSVDVNSIFQFAGGRLEQVDTTTPEACVRQSDIVVTGVPVQSYRLPTEWIRPHTVVVNVASFKNVDEEALLHIPGVLYVPQVGKVTVAMLERNLMRLHEQFHDQGKNSRLKQSPSALSIHPVNVYTAVVVTVLLALHVARFVKNNP